MGVGEVQEGGSNESPPSPKLETRLIALKCVDCPHSGNIFRTELAIGLDAERAMRVEDKKDTS